jgi:RecB family exonuclease
MTLEDLADSIVSGGLGAGKEDMIPDMIPPRLIRMITSELSTAVDGFYFKAIGGSAGFHEAVLATIADLKDAGLSPESMRRHLEAHGVRTKVNHPKLNDFLKIWSRYEADLVRHGWYDEHDLMRAAPGLLHGSALVKQSGALLVYGFYDFNQLERDLLQACIEFKPTTLFVPYVKTGAYQFVEPTLKWLDSLGFEVISEPAPDSDRRRPPILQGLSDNLFSDGKAVDDEDGALTFISTPGELREIRESLRCIVRDCTDDEHGLSRCAIVLRQPDVYSAIIRDEAVSIGLSPYIPEGRHLSETRPGRSLLLLVDILAHDFARQAVMEFATFARLKALPFGGEDLAARPTSWDVISMEAGIVGGREEWYGRLGTLHADIAHEEDDDEPGWQRAVPGGAAAVAALRSFIETLAHGLALVEDGKSWSEKSRALTAAYADLVESEDHTEEVLASLACLGQLDRIGGPEGIDDYTRTVRDLLETRKLRQETRFQRSGPAVLGLMAARGVPFDTVVLPGLAEKGFPPMVRQDAILLDHEREALNAAVSGDKGNPIVLKARRRLEEERLLYTLATGAAAKKLILSYPRVEMITAKERLASSFLLASAEAVTGTKFDFDSLEGLKEFKRIRLSRVAVEAPSAALDEAEFDLSSALRAIAGKKPAAIQHLRDTSPIFRHALQLESERWGRDVFTKYDGLIMSIKAREELKRRHSIEGGEVSPSSLETYAKCPYQYLLGRVMRIRALIEPERAYAVNPLDRGDLVHRILWRYLTELSTKGKPGHILSEDDRAFLHTVAEREFDDFEERGITGFPALWAVEKDRILGWLDRFLDDELEETDFRPAYFEVRYGVKGHEPYGSPISTAEPVPLTLGGCRFLIRGRIDRIDISCDGLSARVIDYKTGDPQRKRENDFLGGTSLQLPLYLHAAAHLLRRNHPAAVPVYAEYYYLKSHGKKRVRFDASTMTEKRDELEDILCTITESMDRGRFFARPGDYCEYCDFLKVCGHVRWAVFDMKSGDPDIRTYLALGAKHNSNERRGGAE